MKIDKQKQLVELTADEARALLRVGAIGRGVIDDRGDLFPKESDKRLARRVFDRLHSWIKDEGVEVECGWFTRPVGAGRD